MGLKPALFGDVPLCSDFEIVYSQLWRRLNNKAIIQTFISYCFSRPMCDLSLYMRVSCVVLLSLLSLAPHAWHPCTKYRGRAARLCHPRSQLSACHISPLFSRRLKPSLQHNGLNHLTATLTDVDTVLIVNGPAQSKTLLTPSMGDGRKAFGKVVIYWYFGSRRVLSRTPHVLFLAGVLEWEPLHERQSA